MSIPIHHVHVLSLSHSLYFLISESIAQPFSCDHFLMITCMM